MNLTVVPENINSGCVACLQTLLHHLAISVIKMLENVIPDVSGFDANESIGYLCTCPLTSVSTSHIKLGFRQKTFFSCSNKPQTSCMFSMGDSCNFFVSLSALQVCFNFINISKVLSMQLSMMLLICCSFFFAVNFFLCVFVVKHTYSYYLCQNTI